MKAKNRTRAAKAQPETQPETLPIPQPYKGTPFLVRDGATIHTHYLSDFGAQLVGDLVANGVPRNDAIKQKIPNALFPHEVALLTGRAPESIIGLGLEWPCTVDDVRRRHHELAKTKHPDRGGDSAEFVIIQKYYEEAMEILGGAL